MHHWYLIQLRPNSYRIAEHNLNQQGFKTFLPMQEVTKRCGSKFRNSIKPLFPGYMFVSVGINSAPWKKINSTLGVVRLVSYSGREPTRLPADIVKGLMSRCDTFGKLLPPKKILSGDTVKILKGAFASFVATVENIDSKQRIWVMMELMGRRTRTHVKPGQIELSF